MPDEDTVISSECKLLMIGTSKGIGDVRRLIMKSKKPKENRLYLINTLKRIEYLAFSKITTQSSPQIDKEDRIHTSINDFNEAKQVIAGG